MKQTNSFLLSVVLSFCSLIVLGQEVEISIDHPEQVNAGEVFEVTVTIDKGALSDYSRFSQDLPLGLSATNVSSPNADFSFDNQRIRIIWLKLPDQPEVVVTYNIMVDERLKGSFILGGVFAYVVEEERKFLNFEKSNEIEIVPNPNVDPALIVDIKDFKGGAAAGATAAATGTPDVENWAMAVRQKPVLLGSGGYQVNLLVQNPTGSKYAKIEESIPSGYLFESVDPHQGIESFSSSTVKFIWMKLPDEAEFTVSYRLVPKRDESQGDMNIRGQLTYSSGNENKVVDIKEVDVVFESLSLAEKRSLLAKGEIPEGAVKSTETAALMVEQPKTEMKEPVKEPVREPVQKPVETAASRPAGASGKVIANTRMLDTGSGVYFRVQVGANRNAFDAKSHYRQAGVDQEVFVEQHQGLYKYTAGSFTGYDQARSYRDKINRLNQVSGAFVVAYRDGNRVPVSAVR